MTARMATEPRRDWLKVGERWGKAYRDEITRQIAGLTWCTEPQAPMMPGLGINACIQQLRLPNVSRYATDGYLRIPPSREEPEGAHFSICGIEANYRNGRARLYVLDTGTEMLPLCADFWPTEGEEG